MEDLDRPRVRPGAAAVILSDLRWLGLDWDEGPDVGGPAAPYLQSGRIRAYEAALDRLKRSDAVYPGTCSGRTAADAALLGDRPFAWRFRVPPGTVAWDDLFQGPVHLDPARSG